MEIPCVYLYTRRDYARQVVLRVDSRQTYGTGVWRFLLIVFLSPACIMGVSWCLVSPGLLL